MKLLPTPRRTALALLVLAMLAVLPGCAKRTTGVDASYTTLEGLTNSKARLLVWQEAPDTITVYTDLGSPGPSTDPDNEPDTVLTRFLSYRNGPGTLYTMVLDGTEASGFQLYRKAGNGGLQEVVDYTLTPVVKWLSTQWEMYSLIDHHPSAYSPPTYIGRGLLGGSVTAKSPLTNVAAGTVAPPVQAIHFLAPVSPRDSLFGMEWTPVSGAAGYWIHIYQFKSNATVMERIASGTPSPIWDGRVKHVLVAYLPGGATSYRIGDPGAEVLTFVPPLRGQSYLVRITAVNSTGAVIGWMSGDRELQQFDGTYQRYPLGAVFVTPQR